MDAAHEKAQQTRNRNEIYRAKLEAKRASIEKQIGAVLDAISADPNATPENKLEAARLAIQLYDKY